MSSDAGSPPSASELLGLAVTAGRQAARLVATMRAEGVDLADTKSSPSDVVTEADRTCEELIRELLLGPRPQDGFVGEEGADLASESRVTWVVDPIDGTVNYLYGIPHYAVSIAALLDEVPVAGVVISPDLGLEYAATLGGGATLNGEPLPVRTAPALEQTLVATGFSYEASVRARQGEAIARMLPQVRDIRRMGSCALDLCAIGSGQVDAYVEEGPHVWDYAAAGLVARETGATFEVWPTGGHLDLVVCAPAPGWADFAGLVRSCGFLENLQE